MVQTSGIRVMTWNIRQGGGSRLDRQVERIAARSPDIVALQEVVTGTAGRYLSALTAIGLTYGLSSFANAPEASLLVGRRRYGTLIASRWPVRPMHGPLAAAPWPERVLSAVVESPHGEVDVHSAYVPVWSNRAPLVKIETLEAIAARAMAEGPRPRILCADLNSPRSELEDGTVVTFAQERAQDGRYYVTRSLGYGERRDQAERRLWQGLVAAGVVDVFRAVHGYRVQEWSWWHRETVGYRLDHMFASKSLVPRRCDYLHALRQARLSDHSPLEADLDWA